MSRAPNDTPTTKITVMLPEETILELDRAALEERGRTRTNISRSELIAAIVESVDIPAIARKIGGGK